MYVDAHIILELRELGFNLEIPDAPDETEPASEQYAAHHRALEDQAEPESEPEPEDYARSSDRIIL